MSTQHSTTAPPVVSPLDQRIDELAHDATWRARLCGEVIPAAMAEYLDDELQALVAGHIEARLEPSGLLDGDYGQDGHPEHPVHLAD